MADLSYSSSFVNFNKIIENDTEELKRLNSVLESNVRLRNTLTLREFEKYIAIFKLNGRDILGNEDYDALCREYFQRISSYHPVHIVDSEGNEVLTLPAVFNSVSCVSDIGVHGSQAIDAFTNANESADEFNIKKKQYTAHLSKLFEAAQDLDKLKRNQDETNRILEKLKDTRVVSNSSNKDIQPFIPEEINKLDSGLSDEVEYL